MKLERTRLSGRATTTLGLLSREFARHFARKAANPTFSDVRNTLRLPPSTTSVYLRKALA